MEQLDLGVIVFALGNLVLVIGGVFLVRRLYAIKQASTSVNHFPVIEPPLSFHYVEPTAETPARNSAETAETPVVRADTKQAQTAETPKNETPSETPVVHISAHLTKTELITLLAVQKDEHGNYVYSANRIRDFVGGTTADVMTQIASIRNPQQTPSAPERGKTLRRPENGWA